LDKVCSCGRPVYYKQRQLCMNCYSKEYYRTHPEYREKHKKYNNKYRKRPEVKKRINEKAKERYHSDEKFRQARLKSTKKYQRKHCRLGLGNPKRIKEICKDFGFSEEVCNAIALDGIVLDEVMKKRGIT